MSIKTIKASKIRKRGEMLFGIFRPMKLIPRWKVNRLMAAING